MKTYTQQKQTVLNRQIQGEFDGFSGVSGRVRLYIYLETSEVGENNRKTKKFVKIGKVLKDLSPESSHYDRILSQCYEKATDIVFKEFYRLKDNSVPFNRIFISEYANIEDAKKDTKSLDYFSR